MTSAYTVQITIENPAGFADVLAVEFGSGPHMLSPDGTQWVVWVHTPADSVVDAVAQATAAILSITDGEITAVEALTAEESERRQATGMSLCVPGGSIERLSADDLETTLRSPL